MPYSSIIHGDTCLSCQWPVASGCLNGHAERQARRAKGTRQKVSPTAASGGAWICVSASAVRSSHRPHSQSWPEAVARARRVTAPGLYLCEHPGNVYWPRKAWACAVRAGWVVVRKTHYGRAAAFFYSRYGFLASRPFPLSRAIFPTRLSGRAFCMRRQRAPTPPPL